MRAIKPSFDFLRSRVSFLKQHILSTLLLVALLQGLLYVFLIPPWWHFDEPGHFEFAWQIVHFDHWPRFGEIDESMRRALVPSLIRYGFYERQVGGQPNLKSNEPVFIGVAAPQTTNYPLYYIVASLPLRILGDADFAIQARAVRLMSLGMFLLTILIIWKSLEELLPEGHPLQWMTVLFLILLPGFADTMTAINDDVGAVLVFSLFAWVSLRILKRGLSWGRLAALLISLALCYWTKTTTWPAFGFAPLVLLFSIFRGKWSWVAWTSIGIGVVGILFAFIRWGDAAFWYRGAPQQQIIRVNTVKPPLGDYAFSLYYKPDQTPWIGQFINNSQLAALRQKTVTLGGWIWADHPVEIQLPTLRVTLHGQSSTSGLITIFDSLDKDTRQTLGQGTCSACFLQIKQVVNSKSAENSQPWVVSPSQKVMLTTVPTFYQVTFDVPAEAEGGWVELIPFPAASDGQPTKPAQDTIIYFDGLVLSQGERKGTPQFDTLLAQSGKWDNHSFQNLIRDASAESGWFQLSPIGDKILTKIFPFGNPEIVVASLQDWQGTGLFYRGIASNLFETFWAKTGVDKVDLLGGALSYRILQWITILALIGAVVALIRKFRNLPWTMLFFLGLTLVGIWGLTIARGGIELLKSYGVLPWARYAFPAALPTALLLCAGFQEVLYWFERWFGISQRQQAQIFIAVFLGLDILAMLSIAHYFYWTTGEEYTFLAVTLVLAIYWSLETVGKKFLAAAKSEEQ